MKKLNKDIKSRDERLFGEFDRSKYMGGCRRFRGIDKETISWLIDNNFLEPDGTQNYLPTTSDFLEFMNKYPSYTAHGYAIIDTRDDYRVTLEGIEKQTDADSKEEFKDFLDLCRLADELEYDNYLRAWWD